MPRNGRPRTTVRDHGEAARFRQVLQVARRLTATLGLDFFQSLVKNLAEVLNVECAMVGEITGASPGRFRTLAAVCDRTPVPNFDLTLQGTALAQVMSDGVFAHSKGVLELFPNDEHVQETGAQGFAGVRLCDSGGQPLGGLAVAGREPFLDTQLALSVLGAFAPRAAAEIERKRNEDIHRESEERYHAFIANNPDAMWRLEFDPPVLVDQPEEQVVEEMYRLGYLAECNDGLARLFGRERADQLLGLPFEIFVPKTDAQLQQDLRSAIRSGFRSGLSERVLTDEGGELHYRLRSLFGIVEDRHLRRIWGNTRDITSLRRAEIAAAASERRFREVLEGIQLPAIMLDPRGTITFCNDCFRQLTQQSDTELASMTWLNGMVSPTESEIWKAALVPAPGSKASFHFEGELMLRAGASCHVRWDTIHLRDQDNRISALAAIGRDLTYERALEVQIRQAQKLDGISRLAAGIAHDFNNLLMIVMGHASQLLEQVTECDRAYGSLTEIAQAATMCTELTRQLLAFGRKQPFKPQLVDIDQVIADSERLVRSMLGEGNELVIERATLLPVVLADPTQIQQVLVNLATNARDAMPEGGALTIATSADEIGAEDCDHPGIKPGTYVRISVTDTGTGVSDEILTQIFEPFVTTKESGKGTGLGLSTVYGIVRQTGGHVTVRSERGRGTTFEILLPAPPSLVH